MKSLFPEKEILDLVLSGVTIGVPHSAGYWNVNPNVGLRNVTHVVVDSDDVSVGVFACGVPEVKYHNTPPAAMMMASTISWVAIFENPSLFFIS